MRLLLVLCLSLLAVFSSQAQNELLDYGDRYFSPVQGNSDIPWGIVACMAQDQQGFTWVGSQAGLLRFDGYRFKKYVPRDDDNTSIAGFWVSHIAVSQNDEIWAVTAGSISILDKVTGEFSHLNAGNSEMPASSVTNIESHGDLMLITTSKHLLIFDTVQDRFLSSHKLFEVTDTAPRITTTLALTSSSVLIGTNSGLFEFDMASTNLRQVNDVPSDEIRNLDRDWSDRIWVSLRAKGLGYLDSALKFHRLKKTSAHFDPNKGDYFVSLQISNEEIWFADKHAGIVVLAADTLELKTRIVNDPLVKHSLEMNDVRSLILDKSGLVWIGSWGKGITLYNAHNQALKTVSLRSFALGQYQELNAIRVRAMPNGDVWVFGAGNPSILRRSKVDPKVLTLVKNIKIKTSIATYGNGYISDSVLVKKRESKVDEAYLLILISSDGILLKYDFELDVVTLLSMENVRPCLESVGMVVNQSQQVWIGCRSKEIIIQYDLQKNKATEFKLSEDLSSGLTSDIAYDNKGRLWLASEFGLFLLSENPDGSSFFKSIEAFKGHEITTLSVAPNGTLWVDGFDGLFRLVDSTEGFKIESVSEHFEWGADQVFGNILFDEKGWLWGDEGVLDPDELRYWPLHKAEGFSLGANWLSSASKSSDGTLIFGALNELLLVKPERFKPWQYLPTIVISQVVVNAKPLRGTPTRLDLPASTKDFSVEVAALDFSAPSFNRYRHKLVGYDSNWVETDAEQRRFTYTNLPSGDYSLRVQGSNRLGQWSDQNINYPVVLAAAFYETWWFRSLIALTASVFVYGLFHLRIRQLQKRERELQTLVGVRTDELHASMVDLEQAQVLIVASEKQALLGRLVRGIAHRLNTPLGIIKMSESMAQRSMETLNWSPGQSVPSELVLGKHQEQSNRAFQLVRDNTQKAIDLVNFLKLTTNENEGVSREINVYQYLTKLFLVNNETIILRGDVNLTITCDVGVLEQVILELVKNSAEHGDKESLCITIEFCLSNQPVESLLLTARDNGVGVDETVLNNIYEPFVTTREDGGAGGLGMYMVHNSVTFKLNGSISYRYDNGACFELTVPVEVS